MTSRKPEGGTVTYSSDSPDGGRAGWTGFWAGLGGRQGGCLPRAEATQTKLRQIWESFARNLPRKARLIDLATGNGVVLTQIARARPDLRLLGVDYASALPDAPGSIQLKAGVALEQLPFADATFDAATSQFGFEYANRRRASAELGRVLVPGGQVLLVLHMKDGTLLRDNRERAEALRWVQGEGLIDKAKALAQARRTLNLATPPGFAQAWVSAQRRFPDDPAAARYAKAILDTLELGRAAGPDRTIAALDQLDSRITEELFLLQSLERAACDRSDLEALQATFRGLGINCERPQALTGPGGPFAWTFSGSKEP